MTLCIRKRKKHDADQDVALAKLESYNAGFSAARSFYDKPERA